MEQRIRVCLQPCWQILTNPDLLASLITQLLPTIHINDLCSVVIKLMEAPSLPYILAVDASVDASKQNEGPPQTLKAVVQALSSELGVGEVFEMANEEVRGVADFEFFQVDGLGSR